MEIQGLPGCCGVKELTNLVARNDALLNMQDFVYRAYSKEHQLNGRFRYALFSEANSQGFNSKTYGHLFAELITREKLGTLIETERNVNPNSGNDVKVWVWTVDHNAVREWGNRNPVDKEFFKPKKPGGYCMGSDCAICRDYDKQLAAWTAKETAELNNGIGGATFHIADCPPQVPTGFNFNSL